MKITRRKVACTGSENIPVSRAHRREAVSSALEITDDKRITPSRTQYAKNLGQEAATVLDEQGYSVSYEVKSGALNIIIHLDETNSNTIKFTLPFFAITPNDEDLGDDTEELVSRIMTAVPNAAADSVIDISEQLDVPEDGEMAEALEAETVESCDDFTYTTSPSL